MRYPLTPNDIDVLLHYHHSPEPHPRAHASAVQEATDNFIEGGILAKLSENSDRISTTPLGDAYVKALCAVPLPKQVFINEKGEVLT